MKKVSSLLPQVVLCSIPIHTYCTCVTCICLNVDSSAWQHLRAAGSYCGGVSGVYDAIQWTACVRLPGNSQNRGTVYPRFNAPPPSSNKRPHCQAPNIFPSRNWQNNMKSLTLIWCKKCNPGAFKRGYTEVLWWSFMYVLKLSHNTGVLNILKLEISGPCGSVHVEG